MPPDEPPPEPDHEAPALPDPDPDTEAKAASPTKGAKPTRNSGAAKRGADRTRGVVMMVLAMLALTAVLTLVAESVWRGPKTKTTPSASAGNAAAADGAAPFVNLGNPSADVIVIAVTFDKIAVDGLEVARTQPLIQSNRTENIPQLQAAMAQKRGGGGPAGRVGLLVEKGVPKNVIKSVFGTLRLAGFNDVHLIGAVPDGGLEGGALSPDGDGG